VKKNFEIRCGNFVDEVLTYLLTHSMVQDIIWKADCHSARQKISRFLTEPEGSSPCSQKPATRPYPEPTEFSSPHRSLSPQGPFHVILPPTPMSSQWSLAFGTPNQNPVSTSPLTHAWHMSSYRWGSVRKKLTNFDYKSSSEPVETIASLLGPCYFYQKIGQHSRYRIVDESQLHQRHYAFIWIGYKYRNNVSCNISATCQ
jgi:hypothetical protein